MTFENYLNNRNDIVLSSSQQELVHSISTFLTDTNGPQCFILRGSAGSGKTFIGSLIKAYSSQGTYIFTPTGRAAKIFRSMVKDPEHRTLISTIHHGIYKHSRVEDEYLSGKSRIPENLESSKTIFKIRENLNSNNAVYICDESSMISDKNNHNSGLEFGTGNLLSDLFTHIGDRKVIFIGDHAQLTPINMEYSPALDESYIQDKFDVKVADFELKEVMRHKKDSGILKNAIKIRDNIIDKENNPIRATSESDVEFINHNNVIDIAHDSFHPDRFSDFTVVTHTRKLSQEYNFSIREKLFPESTSKFVEGDRLMCAQTNYLYNIFNGELLRVKKVFNDEDARISKLLKIAPTSKEKKYSEVDVQHDKKMHIWLNFQKLELEYYDNLGIKETSICYVLENSIDSSALTLDIAENRALLIDFSMRYKTSRSKYISDRRKNSITKYEEQQAVNNGDILNREKDIFYNALITKYGYSLTAHKAQGGEWNRAIIDLSTKFWDKGSEEYLRWYYTAITRAKNNLYLVEHQL